MDRVLRNSKNSSILACGNTHESVSMKALFEFDNLFSLTSYFTNGIEWFWCHFRRMIDGCYHNVSDEHLQAYIDEACYRWNTRKRPSRNASVICLTSLFDSWSSTMT